MIKLDQHDWINLIAALMIIAATVFAATYFYKIQRDECISNPLVYGAMEMKKGYGYDVHGTIYLLIDDPMIRQPTITFSSKNLTIKYG